MLSRYLFAISAAVFAAPAAVAQSNATPVSIAWFDQDNRAVDGELIGFEHRRFAIDRHRGHVRLNGRRLTSTPLTEGVREVLIAEQLDGSQFQDDADFRRWARTLQSPRTYRYDVALVRTDAGVQTRAVVLLPPAVADDVLPLHHRWAADQQSATASMAAAPDAPSPLNSRSPHADAIDQATLDLLQQQLANARRAGRRGESWEVTLGYGAAVAPQPSFYGTLFANQFAGFNTGKVNHPFRVLVRASDSQDAARAAVHKYPGTTVGIIRRSRGGDLL